MKRTLRFLLNGAPFEIVEREEMVALDWIRGRQLLTGTKEGCREGDCGACMVLLGERTETELRWKTALSCLLALGELDGKHVITIEGLGGGGLTPVMEAMLDEGASQCGFCTPGFVVSLTSYLIAGGKLTYEGALRAIEGNLCRCTGYGSIKRAAAHLVEHFKNLPESLPERIRELSHSGVIPERIAELMTKGPEPASPRDAAPGGESAEAFTIGGGTDHYVRNPDPDPEQEATVSFVDLRPELRRIEAAETELRIGAGVSIQDFFNDPLVRRTFPGIEQYEGDFASLPIRNRATLAGNITNASPIGDMTAILLALEAVVSLRSMSTGAERSIPLSSYFLGYRHTALVAGEQVTSISLPHPPQAERVHFNFEKVAKRRHLDIASVNSGCLAATDEQGRISHIALSAGGVGPVPMRLTKTEEYLLGRKIEKGVAARAAETAAAECSPIDDVRGQADYRRALLGRFVWAHLIALFPELELEKELMK